MVEDEEKCNEWSNPGDGEIHRLLHNLWPGLLGQDLEHRHQGIGEGGEIDVEFTGFVVLQIAEQLHGDTGGDQQQVDGEDHEADITSFNQVNYKGCFVDLSFVQDQRWLLVFMMDDCHHYDQNIPVMTKYFPGRV